MTVPTLAAYQKALKDEGLNITAQPGWAEVNRPGPWDPQGVALHHTATGTNWTAAAVTRVLVEGRAGLPGPLAHGGLRRSGIIDLTGWHDTNHAGLVDPKVLNAVKAGTLPPAPRSPSSTIDTADGNAALYGLEMHNAGDGVDPWPAEQVQAAVLYCAALCRLHGWNVNHVVYHKGLTVRKIDPKGFMSITKMRALVKAQLDKSLVRTYTIRDGDNPIPVAERFGVTVRALWNANPGAVWKAGTVLTIPA